jgi:hypothetical protein
MTQKKFGNVLPRGEKNPQYGEITDTTDCREVDDVQSSIEMGRRMGSDHGIYTKSEIEYLLEGGYDSIKL